jgi:hypothetical protein
MTDINIIQPNEYYNPIRLTDFERSIVYGTILLIIGTIIYVMSYNIRVLIIFASLWFCVGKFGPCRIE